MSTVITGSINLACGLRIAYDDTNVEHRLHRTKCNPRPLVTCPEHGPEAGSCAVSGPPHLLWPEAKDFEEAMADLRYEDAE